TPTLALPSTAFCHVWFCFCYGRHRDRPSFPTRRSSDLPTAVLNISRDSMATYGFSPATRIFEAAGAGACLITDSWHGISEFFEPNREILIANSGEDVIKTLSSLDKNQAQHIGHAALTRAKNSHTYAHRAKLLEEILQIKVK